MEAEGRLSWREMEKEHRGGHACPSVWPAKGSSVRIKLYQDQIKQSCQYSRCAHKEQQVRKLILTGYIYILLWTEITKSK